MIQGAVQYVNQKINEFGDLFFACSRRKIIFKDVLKLSIGSYFARKEKTLDVVVAQSGLHSMNEHEIIDDLFSKKLKPFLSSAHSELKLISPITKDIIKLIKKDAGIHAEVACVFCLGRKNVTVQCNPGPKSNVCYWNLSNFGKHIALHKKWVTGRNKEDNIDNDYNNSYCEQGNSAPEDLGQMENINDGAELATLKPKKNAKRKRRYNTATHDQQYQKKVTNARSVESLHQNPHVTGDQNDMLLQQALEQNLENITTTLQNSEKTENMVFNLKGCKQNIKVVQIEPDGSCFFSSIAHQMYGFKANSEENKTHAADLRKKAIAHMKENFEDFKLKRKSL